MSTSDIIVFDLDGTLVDTAPDLVNSLNHVLTQEGIETVPFHRAHGLIGAGVRKMLELGLETVDRQYTQADMERLTKDFVDYYADHIADESRPFEGLSAALDELETEGFCFAVCTNKLEWLAKRLLDKLDMSKRFAAICGADTFGVAKPDPAIFQQTVARAGGNVSRAVMVGDAGPDIGVARRASVPVIGVTFGYTETPIAELNPDVVIEHMHQLPDAARKLFKTLGKAAN